MLDFGISLFLGLIIMKIFINISEKKDSEFMMGSKKRYTMMNNIENELH